MTKTRSSESMVDLEEMNEFRTDMATLKKEVTDLKSLKGEVKEIKELMRELCKQKKVADQGGEGADATAAVKGSTGQGTDAAGPSTGVVLPSTAPEVRFEIEPNVVIPSAPMNQKSLFCQMGGSSGPGVDTTRPEPTVFTQGENFTGRMGGSVFGAPMNHGGYQGGIPNFQAGFNRGPNQWNQGIHFVDPQRSCFGAPTSGGNHYAEAVIKGPRLEISLFTGEDPVDWLKQCEKFFEITGTPVDQWVNLAVAHLYGRAAKWFRGIGLPWQVITWPQWCAMLCTRFSTANVHEAVELFQNVKQYGLTVE